MTAIRPLNRADLPAVAALYEQVARSGGDVPAPGLERYFERLLFDAPWTDPEIPSLVHEDGNGAVVGFLASHVRRFVLDGDPIRVGCSGQLVAASDARHRAVGAFLMRAYLDGPQELSITDGATDTVRRIWERLGGQAAGLSCLGWTRVFRPGAYARLRADERGIASGAKAALLTSPLAPLDLLSSRSSRLRPEEPRGSAEPLTGASLVDALAQTAGRLRLRCDYDAGYFDWLLAEAAAVTARGELRARLARDDSGRVRGWFVYYLARDGISEVLQVAADERGADTVLDVLFDDAYAGGAAALRGRLEPRLQFALTARRCLIRPTELHARPRRAGRARRRAVARGAADTPRRGVVDGPAPDAAARAVGCRDAAGRESCLLDRRGGDLARARDRADPVPRVARPVFGRGRGRRRAGAQDRLTRDRPRSVRRANATIRCSAL